MGLVVFGLKFVAADYVVLPAVRLLLLVAVGVITFAICAGSEIAWLRKEWLHQTAASPP
jgi:hypothetical protein